VRAHIIVRCTICRRQTEANMARARRTLRAPYGLIPRREVFHRRPAGHLGDYPAPPDPGGVRCVLPWLGAAGGWGKNGDVHRLQPDIQVLSANHASTRTTQLYDRRRDEVSLDEVERIAI
jgi:hypothetical protein